MKKLFVLFFLVSCNGISHSESFDIFDTSVSLDEGCVVSVSRKHGIESYKIPFTQVGDCRIVTHDDTNIPHIQYINGMYILFVENNITDNTACHSEYSAIGISNAGQMHTTINIKRSSTCYQGRESKSFEYFSQFLEVRPVQ